MLQVCVVLPTLNERDNITLLMDRILHALPQANLVVVDDNSPDGTADVVRQYAAEHPQVELLLRTTGLGLRNAIQAGIDHSRADVVFWMDCDLSMPPETMPLMLEAISRGADVAIGSRYRPGGADQRHEKFSVLVSAVMNLIAKTALGGTVRDFTTGFVAARRAVLDVIRLQGDYGEYCIDLLGRAERMGFKVEEVPYQLVSRTHGESKTAPTAFGYVRRAPTYLQALARVALSGERPVPRRGAGSV